MICYFQFFPMGPYLNKPNKLKKELKKKQALFNFHIFIYSNIYIYIFNSLILFLINNVFLIKKKILIEFCITIKPDKIKYIIQL
jgi:hypothetical protein